MILTLPSRDLMARDQLCAAVLHAADEYSIVSCCCVLHALRARGPREIFFTRASARAPTRNAMASSTHRRGGTWSQLTLRCFVSCVPAKYVSKWVSVSSIYITTIYKVISKQGHALVQIQSYSFQPPTITVFLYKVQLHITAFLPNCIS